MHNLTQDIEEYIRALLEEEAEDFVELRRKELAEFFGCVPSQINYVLRSRFTPEQGFLIESRRGGNGFIRILKISCESPDEKSDHIDDLVGVSINEQDAGRLLKSFQERGFITMRERLLIEIALRHTDEIGRDDFELSRHRRDMHKAKMLRKMLHGLMLGE